MILENLARIGNFEDEKEHMENVYNVSDELV